MISLIMSRFVRKNLFFLNTKEVPKGTSIRLLDKFLNDPHF